MAEVVALRNNGHPADPAEVVRRPPTDPSRFNRSASAVS
jgi:hypothetical protein